MLTTRQMTQTNLNRNLYKTDRQMVRRIHLWKDWKRRNASMSVFPSLKYAINQPRRPVMVKWTIRNMDAIRCTAMTTSVKKGCACASTRKKVHTAWVACPPSKTRHPSGTSTFRPSSSWCWTAWSCSLRWPAVWSNCKLYSSFEGRKVSYSLSSMKVRLNLKNWTNLESYSMKWTRKPMK